MIASAVEKSYPSDIRNSTRRELSYRTQCAVDIVATLRGDMHWTLQRIRDHLPGFLRMQLNGGNWEPAARSTWQAGTQQVDVNDVVDDDGNVAPMSGQEERLVLLPHEV